MDLSESVRRVRTGLPAVVTSESQLVLAIILPTAGILIAEGFLFFGYAQLALIVYLLLFVGCSLAPLVNEHDVALFSAFLLVSLFRLVNFGTPVFFETTVSWLALIYGGFLFVTYAVAADNPAVELPDRRDARELLANAPLAVVLGGVLATVEFVVLRPEPLVESWVSLDFVTLAVVMVVFVAFGEEFLFRGVLQGTLAERVGPAPAIAVTSLVFGVMHSTHGIFAEVVFGAAIGLLFGYLYHRTENLLLLASIHGTLNVFLFGPFVV